ncbi:MAG: anhydro-N-acetylmuramic acid kinase [Bacteroidales bacterium]
MKYHIIGLMSGTSADGLDLAFCSFEKTYAGHWDYRICSAITMAYDQRLRTELRQAVKMNKKQLKDLDDYFGTWSGRAVKIFMEQEGISADLPDFVASHGHTIFHQPEKKRTLQIGKGQKIADACAIPVIFDFRSPDVKLGGQGAPLVPIGDKHLFSRYDQCLNIGGFSNISMDLDGRRIAWDICPVNTVGNDLANRINLDFDKDGMIAAKGKLIPDLLQKLNALDFYQQKPPKSLGREWVADNVDVLLRPLFSEYSLEDLMRTWYEHAAMQIARHLKGNVLVTGGGAKNSFLIDRIRSLSAADIHIPDEMLVDFKEALIFAFMAVLRYREEVNVLASVTGAGNNHSSGQIVFPGL